MIDYDEINKQLLKRKWRKVNDNVADKFTCYYDEYNHHDICPHQQQCILNREFQDLHRQITQDKRRKKQLENIYKDVQELTKEHPQKKLNEFYVGFNPRENRVERELLRKNIRKNYWKLRNLKTRKGGY